MMLMSGSAWELWICIMGPEARVGVGSQCHVAVPLRPWFFLPLEMCCEGLTLC